MCSYDQLKCCDELWCCCDKVFYRASFAAASENSGLGCRVCLATIPVAAESFCQYAYFEHYKYR